MDKLYKDALNVFTTLRNTDSSKLQEKLQRQYESIMEDAQTIANTASPTKDHAPYPRLGDPDFDKKLLSKKEFAHCHQDRKSTPSCKSGDYSLTKPQQLIRNFVSPYTPYNGILIYHGLGVGKTCAAIQVAESFKNVFTKKAIVIASPNLQASFRSKLYDPTKGEAQCVGLTYKSESIDSNYEFLGYEEFSNIIARIQKENPSNFVEVIENQYSNRVIIVDEAHNMRKVQNKDKNVAQKIEMVLRVARNVKLVLMTATPIFNDVEELQFIMELMYTNDKRFDMVEKVRKRIDNEMLVEFARHYVSYMRGENPYTFPARLWPKETTPFGKMPKVDYKGEKVKYRLAFTPIITSPLSKVQQQAYHRLIVDIVPDEEYMQQNNASYMQATNIVYPNNLSGGDGFNGCFGQQKHKGERMTYQYKTDTEFLHPSTIHKYSTKMAKIIEYIRNSEGIVLVYSEFLAAGILPLAFALEHCGYSNFTRNLLDCKKRERDTGKKYIIVSGAAGIQNNVDKVFPVLNSAENKNGELIKVVLFTSAGAEGLDYRNVREIHLLEPWYNMSKIEQIIGRGVRNCSHEMLPPEKRNCLVCLHASTYTVGDQDRECVDLYAYRRAEEKQLQISKIERVLKENSLDCPLNHDMLVFQSDSTTKMIDSQGNVSHVRLGDVDNSKVCDFTSCKMTCGGRKTLQAQMLDKTTFEEFFIEKEIASYLQKLKKLFEDKVAYTYEDIKGLVKDTDETILNLAINKLTKGLRVQHNGRIGHVIYRSNLYMFQPDDVKDTRISLAERTRQPQLATDKLQHVFKLGSNTRKEIDLEAILNNHLDTISSHDIPRDIAVDYAVDKLNEQQFIKLVSSAGMTEFKKSLERGGAAIPGKNIFYNYFSNKYIDATGNEVSEFAIKQDRMTHEAAILNDIKSIGLKGYIDIKDKKPVFKMMDPSNKKSFNNNRGVVCQSFPQLKKEALLKLLGSKLAGTKQTLCTVYELALRRQGVGFLRPAMYQIKVSSASTRSRKL